MPLENCSKDGKSGIRWGQSGHCYNSPNMKENKKNAIKQALTFTSPEELHRMLKHNKAEFMDFEGLAIAKEEIEKMYPRGFADILTKNVAEFFQEDAKKKGLDEPLDKMEEKKKKKDEDDVEKHKGKTPSSVKPIKAGPEVNNDARLDKDREEVGMNIIIPPYNKEASPETDPSKTPPDGVYQEPLTMEDCRPIEVSSKSQYLSEFVYAYISSDERKRIPDEDFAGPQKTFPIRDQKDVEDAATLLHHAGDPMTVKKNIVRIAHKKGLRLPHTWSHDDAEMMQTPSIG